MRSYLRCLALIIIACCALPDRSAYAHASWSDGTPVPGWVRNACCGPWDIHHLQPYQIQLRQSGYLVDGVRDVIPFAKVLPSEDGENWVFFRNFDDGTQYVFCLFVPPSAS